MICEIVLKFNPLSPETKKVVRELEVFFENCYIEYCSNIVLNIGESLFFNIPDKDDIDDFDGDKGIAIVIYETSFDDDSDLKVFYSEFELLSEKAQKYFNDLCKNNRLKVVEKFNDDDCFEYTLIVEEYYCFY